MPTSGTYVYHSHVGLQLDRGLYGPLIVEPKKEELEYDREYVLLLDDWLDGISGTPEDTLEELQARGGGMMGGGGGQGGTGFSGAVDYPLYLINGRAPDDTDTLNIRRGEKARLRLINPAGETVFRFAVGGHKLTVTHSDGQPVEPVEVDVVRIGPGERYDVIVEANNPGVWQVAAAPEGKNGLARAILRYAESGQSSPHRPAPGRKNSPAGYSPTATCARKEKRLSPLVAYSEVPTARWTLPSRAAWATTYGS